MNGLSAEQVDKFWQDGAIIVENAIPQDMLNRLNTDFSGWVEDSRQHTGPFGQMIDGRPRFDVEPEHSFDIPGLRRVASPTEISDSYAEAAFESNLVKIAADLVGKNVRFHHAKVNSKLPGTKTTVKWHQDFPFDPHSNDDTLTVLLFMEDVTMDNGPLMIVPGSHKGPLYSLWHDGVFIGAIDDSFTAEFESAAVPCYGKAGSACLMHSKVCHASGVNSTDSPRPLYIVTYTAADALPLTPCAVPSVHEQKLVHGVEPGMIRSIAFDLEVPQIPKGASFFGQQEGSIKG